MRFIEEPPRPCHYDPEPHDVSDHRVCRGRDLEMDYDEPEENPK